MSHALSLVVGGANLFSFLSMVTFLLSSRKNFFKRGRDTARISEVQGHADDSTVRDGNVRLLFKRVLTLPRLVKLRVLLVRACSWMVESVNLKNCNDLADRAADFGRRRVPHAIIDSRRQVVSACRAWYPLIPELHRFFIAVARDVVDGDRRDSTSIHPTVWSSGGHPKRRKAGDAGCSGLSTSRS